MSHLEVYSLYIGLLKQDRCLSWSVGGDKSIVEDETLPNMMKVYNPEVRGFSKGWGPVWLESVSHLNLANPGDVSEDIPAQAVKLVDRMKADKTINFQEDWKVITLFIGGNDLCSYCEDKSKYSAESYVANIKTALDYLHANVPRTFVNLVQILDVAMVKNLNAGFICSTLHRFLCDCAAFPANAEAEAELVAETQRYRDLTQALVDTGRYDTRDDFTVIVQPFFTATSPPLKAGTNEIDLSYFSPDCFHLSEKGHRAAADGLWNNMIEPVAAKRRSWTPGELVECPSSAHPYFYTYKNSNTAQAQRSANGNFAAKLNTQTGNTHNTKTGSSSTSAATVSIVAVAMVCIVLALVGALVWRRVKKSERIVLWRQPGSEYNKI
ncbi:phospholipase B1, membrane-associated-like isoform X4 [Dreissena polymorpha]|uniref:phospholipase B1, membrane-associated-like isoform X4 n=1 Tax=Dreissena polymorpha TaxID=45954 RepID=UPI002263E887|nr:phospholipase B1, membrane-associated-like isoform X4 [Dreissena polymorpha]